MGKEFGLLDWNLTGLIDQICLQKELGVFVTSEQTDQETVLGFTGYVSLERIPADFY